MKGKAAVNMNMGSFSIEVVFKSGENTSSLDLGALQHLKFEKVRKTQPKKV